MKKILLALVLIFQIQLIQAQHHVCGTDHVHEQLLQNNPRLAVEREMQEQQMLEMGSERAKNSHVLVIPVVFHVIHDYGTENINKQTILAALEQLNEDFRKTNSDTNKIREVFKDLAADSEIEFRLATKDPNGKCTDGIVRVVSSLTHGANDNVKPLSFWNSNNYLNVWVVASIDLGGSLPPGQVIAGYAYFPGTAPAGRDGIVVASPYLGKNRRTLTHEVGHYLNLYHTFQGGCGSNCNTSGDRVCDTPPTAKANYGCNTSLNTCSNDNPNLPDMIENYMDYSNCQFMFTHGQKNRMRNAIVNYRANLVSQSNLLTTGTDHLNPVTCVPVPDFNTTFLTVCTGNPVSFTSHIWNGEPDNVSWYFPGADPVTSNELSPTIRYNEAGIYQVKLVVSNSAGADSITKEQYITVKGADLVAPFGEPFENATFSPGWEFNPSSGSTRWQKTSEAAVSGNQSLYLNNFGSSTGLIYEFIMPSIDISDLLQPKLHFNVAYARKDENSKDVLRVYVSRDCGNLWSTRYNRSGGTLSTTGYYTGTFIPEVNEWRNEEINLIAFQGANNILVRFEFTSDGGNDIFIDDILITGQPSSIVSGKILNEYTFSIYPNPADYRVTFTFNTPEAAHVDVYIADILGREVSSFNNLELQQGENVVHFTTDQLNITNAGVYLLRAKIGDSYLTRKLIINKH